MTGFILRKFLDGSQKDGRKKAGILLGAAGIFFDLLLFATKHIAGLISGSVAITADAYNNLADAGAHILALLAFPLGAKKPSRRFPFGCGRLEYLSGLVIAAAILIVGGRMLVSSAEKIRCPTQIESSPAVIVILLFSIAVKAYMYRYNKRIGGIIDAAGLKSVATDSLCDCLATGAIILSVMIQKITGIPIDGWIGLMVAGCILCAGILAAKDSLAPLIGVGIDDETMDKLCEMLEEIPDISAVGDVAVHDYGPARRLLTMRIAGTPEAAAALRCTVKSNLHMDAVIEISKIERTSNNCGQSRQE